MNKIISDIYNKRKIYIQEDVPDDISKQKDLKHDPAVGCWASQTEGIVVAGPRDLSDLQVFSPQM